MSFLLQHLFGVHKPVIGMAHLPALPGTPRHDSTLTLARTIDMVASDVDKLTLAGVDAILFCNADDRPYQTKAGVECVAFMTRIISEIRLHDRPFRGGNGGDLHTWGGDGRV
jgi:predicted TIM-barrel enzyme